jgi:tRNA/rRNA methyltransferase
MQKNVEIILVHTQLPENLGSAARGMLNFEFEKLRVVKPKFDMDNEKIIPVSAGADKVIIKARSFEKLSDAIKDFNFVIGTTNRSRAIKKKEIKVKDIVSLISNRKKKVALIFGPEQSGLDNESISLCDYIVKIDSNPKFSSLNVSQAVTVICNQIFEKLKNKKKSINFQKKEIAKKKELILFYEILEKRLELTNFFKVEERKKIIFQKIKNIFSKSELSSIEVKILISIIKNIKK